MKTNNITSADVERIYNKVEKSKKGTFFIDKNDNKIEITPNHIDENVAKFLTNGSFKEKIKSDATLAKNILEGSLN